MTTMAIVLMSGCARPLIAPDDRARICEVAVEEKGEAVTFRPNALSHPVGGPVMGALGGALGGASAVYFNPYTALIAIPVGATIGLAAGTVCGAAASAHPEAEAQFRSVLETSRKDILKQTLLGAANSARPECGGRTIVAGPGIADTIIDVDEVSLGTGCLFGKQGLTSVVRWRVLDATDRRVLGESETRCTLSSSSSIEEWYADPAQARAEIELLLARTGREMAAQLRAPRKLEPCRIDLNKAGEGR
jgi:hypothetical protein